MQMSWKLSVVRGLENLTTPGEQLLLPRRKALVKRSQEI